MLRYPGLNHVASRYVKLSESRLACLDVWCTGVDFSALVLNLFGRTKHLILCLGGKGTNVQPEERGGCSWRKRSWRWIGWRRCRSSCRCRRSPPWRCRGSPLSGRQNASCPVGWRWGIHWGSIGMTAHLHRKRSGTRQSRPWTRGESFGENLWDSMRNWFTLNNVKTCK